MEVIVGAALALIDADGLERFSTRRLADQLGIFQPSIYRRIADRDELLGLVADAIVAEAGLPDVGKAKWRDWLLDCGLRLHRAWARHPNAAPLVLHGGAHPAILRLLEEMMGMFLDGGFARDQVSGAWNAYLGFVFGTIMLAPLRPTDRGYTADVASAHPSLDRARKITQAERAAKGRAASSEKGFLEGLKIVLDGLEPLRRPRRSRRQPRS